MLQRTSTGGFQPVTGVQEAAFRDGGAWHSELAQSGFSLQPRQQADGVNLGHLPFHCFCSATYLAGKPYSKYPRGAFRTVRVPGINAGGPRVLGKENRTKPFVATVDWYCKRGYLVCVFGYIDCGETKITRDPLADYVCNRHTAKLVSPHE